MKRAAKDEDADLEREEAHKTEEGDGQSTGDKPYRTLPWRGSFNHRPALKALEDTSGPETEHPSLISGDFKVAELVEESDDNDHLLYFVLSSSRRRSVVLGDVRAWQNALLFLRVFSDWICHALASPPHPTGHDRQ